MKKILIIPFIFLSILIFPKISFAGYWDYEGIAYYTPEQTVDDAVPVYRFWSSKHKGHFFTASEEERDLVMEKYDDYTWKYEGIGWHVFKTQKESTEPVYRFWSSKHKHHFYTASKEERDIVINEYDDHVWKYEGIAWYAYKSSRDDTKEIYRFWHTSNKAHFYTSSEEEKNLVIQSQYGPDITIGLHEYTRDELEENSFRITSDEKYKIKDEDGATIATISADEQTRVKYLNDDDHTFRIYNSVDPEITTTDELYFEISDGDGIFEIDQPDMDYSEYRGKIKLRYSNNNSVKRIWVINELPLEQYVWGMGEITGTGPTDYNRVMTTSYRTYGYWKILYSTAYAVEGFDVNATPGNQLYRGYEWEQRYPRIRAAAEDTRGKIVTHDGDVAITPYSSWTDGRTRDPDEVGWSASVFPHCKSVNDPYGDYNGDYWDNPTYKSTSTLMSEGNHMVGLSAHGGLTLANDKDWSWTKILNYYFDDIDITSIY